MLRLLAVLALLVTAGGPVLFAAVVLGLLCPPLLVPLGVGVVLGGRAVVRRLRC